MPFLFFVCRRWLLVCAAKSKRVGQRIVGGRERQLNLLGLILLVREPACLNRIVLLVP